MEQLGQIQWKYSDPNTCIRGNLVSATCPLVLSTKLWPRNSQVEWCAGQIATGHSGVAYPKVLINPPETCPFCTR
jgi:hypothetical protein